MQKKTAHGSQFDILETILAKLLSVIFILPIKQQKRNSVYSAYPFKEHSINMSKLRLQTLVTSSEVQSMWLELHFVLFNAAVKSACRYVVQCRCLLPHRYIITVVIGRNIAHTTNSEKMEDHAAKLASSCFFDLRKFLRVY